MADDPIGEGGDPIRIANHTLRSLQGMQRDYAAVIERQSDLMKVLTGVQRSMDAIAREMRDGTAAVRSDIVGLENQNFSRHGELLNVMRRLDDVGFPAE